MKLTALIIEDEQKGRDALRNLLQRFCPQVTVVGEAPTVRQGIEIIEKENPVIVFLDIELPEQNGFALLDHYSNPSFEIIFTTAYDQFAVKAFRISAVDYLLKPINFQQLQEAVAKVEAKQASQDLPQAHSLEVAQNELERNNDDYPQKLSILRSNIKNIDFKKIALPTASGYQFVHLKEIAYCEANRNYTYFYFSDGKKAIVSKPLRHFETILCEFHFFRINRSVIINLQVLKGYSRTKSGEVYLEDGKIFPLSESKKKSFLARVNLMD